MKKLFLFVSLLFLTASAFAQQPSFFNTYYYGNPQYQSIYAGTPGILWGNNFLNLWQTYNSTTAGWQPINTFDAGEPTSNIYGTATLTVSNIGTVLDSSIVALDTVTLPSTTNLPNGTKVTLKRIFGSDSTAVAPGTNAVGTAQKIDGSTSTTVAINTAYGFKTYFVYKGNWYTK